MCLGRGRGSGYYHMPTRRSLMIRALHTVASGSGPPHIKVIRQSADPYSIPCIEGHGSHVRRLEGVILSGATLLFVGATWVREDHQMSVHYGNPLPGIQSIQASCHTSHDLDASQRHQ